MPRIKKYSDEFDEFLHPFWLGLIMLFTIIAVVGMLCLVRKKCGSQLYYLFNRLRCKSKLNDEHHTKINKHLPITHPYNWAPTYVPASSSSPKFYKLVRNIQTISMDKESSFQHIENDEDNTMNNDTFSIIDESDQVKIPPLSLNENRNSETARKFYASMRYTSQCPNSSSVESSSVEPALSSTTRSIKSNRFQKLKFLRTSRFLQSISNV